VYYQPRPVCLRVIRPQPAGSPSRKPLGYSRLEAECTCCSPSLWMGRTKKISYPINPDARMAAIFFGVVLKNGRRRRRHAIIREMGASELSVRVGEMWERMGMIPSKGMTRTCPPATPRADQTFRTRRGKGACAVPSPSDLPLEKTRPKRIDQGRCLIAMVQTSC